jgi:hypothetical protein
MSAPVISRVDLDAEPVHTRNGAREVDRRSSHGRRYDGTDEPAAAGELTSPPGNGNLDRPELESGERNLARVLGW